MGGPDVSHRVLSVPSLVMAVTLARNYSFLSIYGVSPLPARAPLRSLGYISAAVRALTFPSRRFLSGRLPQPNTRWRFSCNGGKLESSRQRGARTRAGDSSSAPTRAAGRPGHHLDSGSAQRTQTHRSSGGVSAADTVAERGAGTGKNENRQFARWSLSLRVLYPLIRIAKLFFCRTASTFAQP